MFTMTHITVSSFHFFIMISNIELNSRPFKSMTMNVLLEFKKKCQVTKESVFISIVSAKGSHTLVLHKYCRLANIQDVSEGLSIESS